jgi:hypothetical protein
MFSVFCQYLSWIGYRSHRWHNLCTLPESWLSLNKAFQIFNQKQKRIKNTWFAFYVSRYFPIVCLVFMYIFFSSRIWKETLVLLICFCHDGKYLDLMKRHGEKYQSVDFFDLQLKLFVVFWFFVIYTDLIWYWSVFWGQVKLFSSIVWIYE